MPCLAHVLVPLGRAHGNPSHGHCHSWDFYSQNLLKTGIPSLTCHPSPSSPQELRHAWRLCMGTLFCTGEGAPGPCSAAPQPEPVSPPSFSNMSNTIVGFYSTISCVCVCVFYSKLILSENFTPSTQAEASQMLHTCSIQPPSTFCQHQHQHQLQQLPWLSLVWSCLPFAVLSLTSHPGQVLQICLVSLFLT